MMTHCLTNVKDWKLARRVAESLGIKVMIAGGINAENMIAATEIIGKNNIYGFDTCSGVEESAGVKCIVKLESYLELKIND